MGYIYSIRNKTNGKQYIGSTTQPDKRKIQHFSDLRRNRHYNKHLQYSFNKYGESSFDFEILEECVDEVLAESEKKWIHCTSVTNPDFGFNATNEPYAPMRGKKHTKKTLDLFKVIRPKGSEHPHSKIDEVMVVRIFFMFGEGLNQKQISEQTGVDQTNISLIIRGKAWKHVDIPRVNGRCNNKSGCVGVYFQKSINKWKAEIIKNKVYHNLGTYFSYEEAVTARQNAEGGVSSDTK